jgi:hypothetical protein
MERRHNRKRNSIKHIAAQANAKADDRGRNAWFLKL